MFETLSSGQKIAAAAAGGVFLGGVLAASFLPVAPVWRQVMIGVTLTGGQAMYIGAGSLLKRVSRGAGTRQPRRRLIPRSRPRASA